MVTRKDNYGNVTQYFYTHPENPSLITHIYNPRDGRLMTLMYDDRSHLIFAQIFHSVENRLEPQPFGTTTTAFLGQLKWDPEPSEPFQNLEKRSTERTTI
ncbi:unnamed protein product [Allacma fusca]|uniref:Teneurin-like YD-shell domain-containing protein n=1 Tax=Allacma fusca TaxID=39272 RepID=A0A8J2LD37_9HEXA|nr:unnamed protein product [Allacma fusca]